MILINLLPHREERRQLRKKAFFAILGLSAVLGLLITGVWFTVLKQLTSAQQDRNQFLTTEIQRLETQIKDIATLRAEIEALQARQKAVEGLQQDRNTPVYLLDELVKQTPEGVYLKEIKQNGNTVLVSGHAQTNERVSEFLRNTLHSSAWLEKPELVEIKAVMTGTAGRDQRRLSEFQMRVNIKRAPSPGPAASGAAAMVAGAAPAASSPIKP